MKTITTLLCLFAGSFFLNAQIFDYYNVNFDLEQKPCPFDNSQSVIQPSNYLVYQTLNNKWDGPIDSTVCINFEQDGFIEYLLLDGVDISRAIFFRHTLEPGLNGLLYSNWLYALSGSIFPEDGVILDNSDDCTNGFCSGLLARIQIPDESGAGVSYREYVALNTNNWAYFHSCFPTEFFAENVLTDLIFKITVDELVGDPAEQRIRMFSSEIQAVYDPAEVFAAIIPEAYYSDTSYNIPVDKLSGFGYDHHILMHNAGDYPSSANPYFVEAVPEVNPDTQTTINIFVNNYQSFVYQPFTSLRGAFIENSDSIRHNVNVINNGSNLCVNLIEYLFQQGTNYVHQGGTIDLQGKTACMQFREGGALVVADDTALEYGATGHGMLALRTGGTIHLGENSQLTINNTVKMWAYGSDQDDPIKRQIYMDLHRGAHLAFGPDAEIIAPYDTPGEMRLNIYMKGGTIDLGQLPPDQRALIHLIYPEPASSPNENLELFPNPAISTTTLSYLSQGDETISIRVIDTQGKLIHQQKETCHKGFNFFELDPASWPMGIYLIQVEGAAGLAVKKLVKGN